MTTHQHPQGHCHTDEHCDDHVHPCQIMIILTLISFVLFVMIAFQTTQIVRDRDSLNVIKGQQDKPLEESRKVQQQLSALALGTKKLADGGNKSATTIINNLKQIGVTIGDQPSAAQAGSGVAPTVPAAPQAPTP